MFSINPEAFVATLLEIWGIMKLSDRRWIFLLVRDTIFSESVSPRTIHKPTFPSVATSRLDPYPSEPAVDCCKSKTLCSAGQLILKSRRRYEYSEHRIPGATSRSAIVTDRFFVFPFFTWKIDTIIGGENRVFTGELVNSPVKWCLSPVNPLGLELHCNKTYLNLLFWSLVTKYWNLWTDRAAQEVPKREIIVQSTSSPVKGTASPVNSPLHRWTRGFHRQW